MSAARSKVFVYGTLLAGEPNSRLLARSQRLGDARTGEGFALFDLGAFPGMVRARAGVGSVIGELYEVDDETLEALDRLEGHPSFYRRTAITLAPPRDAEPVWTYLLRPEQVAGRKQIPSGSWRAHRAEERRR
jgi:gamma-glutamylaminecyclotransferase